MGGVWEWMIGIVRRIFDFMFMDLYLRYFIYEVLIILMVEVCVIVNFRLIVFVCFDFEFLVIFSLNMLFI